MDRILKWMLRREKRRLERLIDPGRWDRQLSHRLENIQWLLEN